MKYFSSSALYGTKQLCKSKTHSIKNGCSFSNEPFSFISGFETPFQQNSARKIFFNLSSVEILDILYVRWTKNSNLVEPLVMLTCSCSYLFLHNAEHTHFEPKTKKPSAANRKRAQKTPLTSSANQTRVLGHPILQNQLLRYPRAFSYGGKPFWALDSSRLAIVNLKT